MTQFTPTLVLLAIGIFCIIADNLGAKLPETEALKEPFSLEAVFNNWFKDEENQDSVIL